ncbi:hypothetical protein BgiBS90_005536, partial [Biomphalaria glabrata]
GRRKKSVDFNLNKSASNNSETKLVSFLESLNTDKGGVIRTDHREQFNIKQYIQLQRQKDQTTKLAETRMPHRIKKLMTPNPLRSCLEPSLKLHTARISHFGTSLIPKEPKKKMTPLL